MINVIEAIEKQLQAQKDEIFFKDLQIEDLKNQLSEAEKELAEAKKENAALTATLEAVGKKEIAATCEAIEKYIERGGNNV